jgi:hypothetical protein
LIIPKGPSPEELVSQAILELPDMSEEKLQQKVLEEGEAAVQKLKSEVETRLKAEAEKVVQDLVVKKVSAQFTNKAWRIVEGHLDTVLAPVGYHGLKQVLMVCSISTCTVELIACPLECLAGMDDRESASQSGKYLHANEVRIYTAKYALY